LIQVSIQQIQCRGMPLSNCIKENKIEIKKVLLYLSMISLQSGIRVLIGKSKLRLTLVNRPICPVTVMKGKVHPLGAKSHHRMRRGTLFLMIRKRWRPMCLVSVQQLLKRNLKKNNHQMIIHLKDKLLESSALRTDCQHFQSCQKSLIQCL
jgi:hypothetical protein